MKYSEIKTIADVKQWLKEHPNHIISSAWKDMIEENEEYTLDDFFEESEYQMFSYAGGLHPDEIKE
jgi:hypothetical protein